MQKLAPRLLKLIGLLLLTAALLKAYGFAVEPVRPSGFLANPTVQMAVFVMELLLGGWFLFGGREASAWLIATCLFTVFACVSFSQGWVGETSCGCFGRVKVSPWIAFLLDIGLLLALFFARPSTLSRAQLKDEISSVKRPVFLGGFAVAAILTGLGLLSWLHFGSVAAGFAYLRGDKITGFPPLVNFGASEPGQLRAEQITLQNWTDDTIRVVGGTDNCSCVTTHDLPLELPPGHERIIKVSLRVPDSPGAFNVRAFLVMNDGRYGRVPIRLTGVVRKSAE